MTNTLLDLTTRRILSKEVKPMTSNDIAFARQMMGYDRAEVDSYVENLSLAYQTAYDEYNSVCAKYNGLLEEYGALWQQQEQNKSNAAVIARTLVDTETLAHTILADAQAQADKLAAETQAAVKIIRDDAFAEKVAAARHAQKLIDDATAEMTGIQERAREVIRSAKIEADQISGRARQNLEQTNRSIAGVLEKLKDILPPEALDPQQAQKQETTVCGPQVASG